MMAETYQHSGRVGAMGIPLMFIGGSVTAVVVGVIYAYGIAWIPLIYAAFLLTGALGAGIGIAVGLGGKAGKVRNPFLVGIFAVLCGVLGLLTAWACDGMAKFPADINEPMLDPQQLIAWAEFCYAEGTWGIGKANATVKGPFLAVIWVVEAACVLGLAWVVARSFVASTPFCEDCLTWTDTQDDYARLIPPEDNSAALESLCSGDVSTVNQFKKAPPSAGAYLRLDLASCPDCDQCQCVSVALAEVTEDKNGDNQINTQMLAQQLLISGEQLNQLRQDVGQLETHTFDQEDVLEDDEADQLDS